MKKLLIAFLLISSVSQAQNLDTVVVNGLTQKADVWAAFVGVNSSSNDSLSILVRRRIEATVRANVPANWNTDVTINNLPGRAVVEMYRQFVNMPAGVISSRYTAIRNAFRSRLNILSWLDAIEAEFPYIFNRPRDIGAHILLDL